MAARTDVGGDWVFKTPADRTEPTPEPPVRVLGGWVPRNAGLLAAAIRISVGLTLVAGGFVVFTTPPVAFAQEVAAAGTGPWFAFWGRVALGNPAAFAEAVAGAETAVGLGVIIGFARKPVYLAALVVAIFLWTVPEGLGGLVTGSGANGSTGLIVSAAIVSLIVLGSIWGPDPAALDFYLVARWPRWARVSEFEGPSHPISPPSYSLAVGPAVERPDGVAVHQRKPPRSRRRRWRWI